MSRTRLSNRPRLGLAGVLACALAVAAAASAAPAVHASTAPPALSLSAGIRAVGAADLASVTGGTCSTCSSDDSSTSGGGGGGGGTGSSGAVYASGTPYWETYRISVNSIYDTPSSLVSRINNWSGQTIQGTYQYSNTVVRDVKFSGSFASVVSVAVGGEVRKTTTATVTYPVPPMSYGKLFVRYHTERLTYYGRRFQPMSDGSRVVIDSASGPYESTSTVLGYVTGGL